MRVIIRKPGDERWKSKIAQELVVPHEYEHKLRNKMDNLIWIAGLGWFIAIFDLLVRLA